MALGRESGKRRKGKGSSTALGGAATTGLPWACAVQATHAGELMSQVVPLMERCVLPVALQCATTVVKEKGGSRRSPALLLPLSASWDLMGATAVGCAGVFSALGPPERVNTSAVP